MNEINVFEAYSFSRNIKVTHKDVTFVFPEIGIGVLQEMVNLPKLCEALYDFTKDGDVTPFLELKTIPYVESTHNTKTYRLLNVTDDKFVEEIFSTNKTESLGLFMYVVSTIYAIRHNIDIPQITTTQNNDPDENQIVIVDATEASKAETRAERIARKRAQIEQYNREHVVVDISPAARKSAQQNNTNPVIVPINTQHNVGCTCGNCSTVVPGSIDSRTIRYNYYNYCGLVRDGQVIARNLTGPDMNRHSIEEIMSVVSYYQSMFQAPGSIMKIRNCPRCFLEDNDNSIAETVAARNAMQQKQVNAFDVCAMDKIYPESVLDIALFTKADIIDPTLSGICHVPAFSICVDYKACIAKYTIDANGNKFLKPMPEPTIYVGCNLTYNGKDLTHWFRNEPTEDPVIIASIPFSMQNLNECLKAIAGIFGIIV